MSPETAAAFSLLSAEAVRTRAHRMLALALDDKLPNFTVALSKLDATAEQLLAVTRAAYPTLDIPFHSRWRHFVVAGVDRFATVAQRTSFKDVAARARAQFDLAMVSVFLDAGAGAKWRYHDVVTGQYIGRSEGLALASLDMFARGDFSADPTDPLRADASVLATLSAEKLAQGFQVTPDNPLDGLKGRAALLRALGQLAADKTDVFARNDRPRPGGLFDHIAAQADGDTVKAPAILSALLYEIGPIWPLRLSLGGVPLGDCWKHSALVTDDATNNLVPLHKLSQWLSYSLIEPLQNAGFNVTDIDGLTGLAEYRNGGLLVDAGILLLREPAQAGKAHPVDSELVVEWRALTIALLDKLAEKMRAQLNMSAKTLPLVKVLEGGTWATGRMLARERRADGAPPITIISDGTVF